MTAAVEEAYKNQRMVGKFPGCVIHLTVKPNEVDVNVHPTKTEVKFQREQQVFSTVYYAVLSALDRDHTRPQAVMPGVKAQDSVTPNQTALPFNDSAKRAPQLLGAGTQFMPSSRFKPMPGLAPGKQPEPPKPTEEKRAAPAAPRPAEDAPPARSATKSPFQWVEPLPDKKEGLSAQNAEPPAKAAERVHTEPKPPRPTPKEQEELLPAPPVEKTVPAREQKPEPEPQTAPVPEPPLPGEEPWVIRGELFRTYVMVEQGDKVLLIDKHAAHERANFDKLKADDYQPMVQELLTPLTFNLAPEERELLLEQTELLARFGFEVEEFGSALAVRAAPDYLETGDIEPALSELARRLRLTGAADPAGARDELLHTLACKAAIKGGWRSGEAELEEAARLVMSGAVKYCPHGRPVAVELKRKQLEKQFKRS